MNHRPRTKHGPHKFLITYLVRCTRYHNTRLLAKFNIVEYHVDQAREMYQ